jgi:hypothetical protein
MSNSTNSNLINGFSDYKILSNFFQNLAQDLKSRGECKLGGHTLLERFCEADGVVDRRTIKAMFDKIENPFIDIKSYDDLNDLVVKNDYDFTILDSFFENNNFNHIEFFGEPNYDEPHECFFAESPLGQILFGEVEKAPYFSKHIKTNGKKYFVTIDRNTMVGENCELLYSKTFVSDDFGQAVAHMKLLINNCLNKNYLNSITDDEFLHAITHDSEIKEMMESHWEETDKADWKDEEIIPAIKEIFNFERKISNELFKEIKKYINQHMFFDVTGYKTIKEFEDCSGDYGDDLGSGYYFYKDAYNEITEEELNEYAIIWIRSSDSEECDTVTKESYKKIV